MEFGCSEFYFFRHLCLKKIKTVDNDEKITVDEENSKNVSFNKNIITDEEIKPTISNFSKLEENSEKILIEVITNLKKTFKSW